MEASEPEEIQIASPPAGVNPLTPLQDYHRPSPPKLEKGKPGAFAAKDREGVPRNPLTGIGLTPEEIVAQEIPHTKATVPLTDDKPIASKGEEDLATLEPMNLAVITPGEPPPEDAKLLDELDRTGAARGLATPTIKRYRTFAQQFLVSLREDNTSLSEVTSEVIARQVAKISSSPVTQNFVSQAVRSLLRIAQMQGISIPMVDLPINKIDAPLPGRRRGRPRRGTMPEATQAAPQVQSIPPAPTPIAAPEVHAAQPKTRSAASVPSVVPTGSRVRISKRATGYEPGIAPGSQVELGTYYINDIEGDGTVKAFIERHIHPRASKGAIGGHIVYVVDQLDPRGNKTRSDEFPFAVLEQDGAAPWPGMAAGTPQGAPAPQGWPPPPTPVAPQAVQAPPTALERTIETLMEREKQTQARYELLFSKVMDLQNSGQRIDPALQALLIQTSNQGTDLKETLKELQRQREDEQRQREREEQRQRERDELAREREARERESSTRGLSGIDQLLAAPPPRPDPMQEAIAEVVKRSVTPAAAPAGPSMAEQLMMMAKIFEVMRPPPPPPPPPPDNTMVQFLMTQVADLAKANRELTREMSKPVEGKGFVETIREAKAVVDALSPQSSPPSIGEFAMAALENAPAIGEAIAKVFQARAPQLPPRAAARPAEEARRALPPALAQPSTAKQEPAKQAPALPEEAKQAIIAMVRAEEGEAGQQVIADNLFSLFTTLGSAPDPWSAYAQAIYKHLLQVETRPEIRSLINNVFQRLGAGKLATPQVLDKITDVVHVNYTLLYKQLTGQEKVLADAVPPPAPAPTPASSADGFEAPDAAALAADVASGEEGEEEEEEEEGEEEDEELADSPEGEDAEADALLTQPANGAPKTQPVGDFHAEPAAPTPRASA